MNGLIIRIGAAPRAFGHRETRGPGLRTSSVPTTPPPGHRSFLGAARSGVTDNQADLVPQVLAERRRRALYLGDDRAPEFTDRHRNHFQPSR